MSGVRLLMPRGFCSMCLEVVPRYLDKSMVSGPIAHQVAGKIKDIVTRRRQEATDRVTGEDRPKRR